MITVIIVIFLIYLIMLRGRTGNPGMEALRGWSYAHRGVHDDRVPENSMAAFRLAVEAGYGMELDVHLMADGKLAVIHDHSLKRTAGIDQSVEELTAEQLPNYKLEGTEETVPLFTDVLKLVDGRTPLIVEIKTHGDNFAAATEATCATLKDYQGAYCIESFDPRVLRYMRKHYPEIIRGQLAHNSLKDKSGVSFLLRFMLTYDLMNFLTLPDFIAYHYATRKTLSNFLCRKVWGVQGVSWTIREEADYHTVVEEGWLPIFEGFTP